MEYPSFFKGWFLVILGGANAKVIDIGKYIQLKKDRAGVNGNDLLSDSEEEEVWVNERTRWYSLMDGGRH